MTISGRQILDAFRNLKWKQHRESSLSAGLLSDVPLEVELSEYGRLSSPESESPSRLLDGERQNLEPIADLDLFFERIYSYYCEKGLWCIILKWIVELLSIGFTICFSGFVLLYVDWNGLRNAKCGMDAVESGMKPCNLAKEAIHDHPLIPLTLTRAIIIGYLTLFSIYWIICFLRFFVQLKDVLRIRDFYNNCLHVNDNEIKTMPWAEVLDKIVSLQASQQLCVVKSLSAHEVVMRLMRKENYLIGMLNKGVLAFPIWVPGAGPGIRYGQDGTLHHLILTKTLEWTLHWCILQSMFDRNFYVKRDFISNPRTLKRRLMIVGFAILLLSPFLVIFMLVYLFLRHAEQFYNHPTTASSRRWSNLAKWMFREFNEVDHLFKHRINSSMDHASEYLRQFPSPMISLVAKFISFVSGGFAATLVIVAFLEESLLEGHIFGRNLFWYAAVFGTITAISRAAASDDLLVLDPEGTMSTVVQYTHHMPRRWRGKESTETVRKEFETLFQYTGMMLLEEMASIFVTPFLLLFVVPKRVETILQFIADFTVNIDGVGHVCSFSTFDFQSHGNCNYGSPCNTSRSQRSCQGKMEKSFLSFQSNYPSSEPSPEGKLFLTNLKNFREQNLHSQGISHTRTPRKTSAWKASSPGGYRSSSLWLIEEEPRHHPYLLDWYYVSRHCSSPAPVRSNQTAFESGQLRSEELWLPADLANEEDKFAEEKWYPYNDDRIGSQLGASTSSRAFNNSIFQPNDSLHQNRYSQAAGSHWWARTGPRSVQPHTSFLEPPEFGHHRSDNHLDEFSERSWQEEGQHLDLGISRRSGRNLFDDDVEAPSLHFDDVYAEPPEAPPPVITFP